MRLVEALVLPAGEGVCDTASGAGCDDGEYVRELITCVGRS